MKIPMVHLIIGEGRGKTTSAYGLALRALGHGLSVAVVNFLKSDQSGELQTLKKLASIESRLSVYCFERQRKFYYQLNAGEQSQLKQEVEESLACIRALIDGEQCDLLILDEIVDAVNLSLVETEELLRLLSQSKSTEVVMTGRNPNPKLYDAADYISEIKKIKHPYDRGILARIGIEY